jgi:hypothetical protein
MSELGSFAVSIQAWAGATAKQLDDASYFAVEELAKRVIMRTPVDKTRPDEIVARGDWNAAVNAEPGDVERNDPSGEEALSVVQQVARAWAPSRNGGTFYLGNYKPYIQKLEYGLYHHDPFASRTTSQGFSTQAPAGMVGITVQEWPDIWERAMAKAGGSV